MTAKVMAAWMFAVVLAAEYVTMILLGGALDFQLHGPIVALIDAALVASAATISFLTLLCWVSGFSALKRWQNWINASLIVLTIGGFESVLHPLAENVSLIGSPVGMEVFNAVLLAAVVSLMTAWVAHVEVLVDQIKSDASNRTFNRSVMAGVLICALCLTSASALREVNAGMEAREAAVGLEVNNAMARLRGQVLQVGRQALLQQEMLSGAQGFRTALNLAVAQESHTRALVNNYYVDNHERHAKFHRLPDPVTLGGSWLRFVSAARAVDASSVDVLIPSAIQLQYVIDEFRLQSDRLVEAVAAIERERQKHRGSGIEDAITATLGLLMALSMLQPILRLTGAQMARLGISLAEIKRANSNLEAYQRALDQHAIFAVTNATGKILQVNDQFLKVSKYTREELIGQPYRILHSGVHGREFYEDMWRTMSQKGMWRNEFCNRARDGSLYWVDSSITPLVGDAGKIERYVSISYDITARKQAEQSAERKKRLEVVVDAMRSELLSQGSIYGMLPTLLGELNLVTGASSSLVVELGRNREGQAWGMMLGHARRHIAGDESLPLSPPDVEGADDLHPLIKDALLQQEAFGGQGARQLGSACFVAHAINVGYEPVGVLLVASKTMSTECESYLQYVINALSDLMSARRETDRRRVDQENQRRLAKRDPLTGLGNRRELTEEFESRADHPDAKFALLLLDLDRFKPINDTFGHLVGDTVLRVVSERLNAVAKGDCTVARIGGDEFAVLTEACFLEDEAGAMAMAHELIGELSSPIVCDGHELTIGASVGVALYPRDGKTFQDVLHSADAAMYRAKVNRSDAQVFNAAMDDGMRLKAELETDLKRALEEGGIEPFFQPFVDLNTGEVVGHEVLARWKHPLRGWVSPEKFVKIAEEAGLVDKLFWQMLRKACAKHLQGGFETVLSVNLSPAQINNPIFAKQLIEEVGKLNFPPRLLEVEITETSMVGDMGRARPLLLLLKSHGIQIALDDFGTGYSSLALLRSMPISKLKIDRSFSSDLESEDAGRATLVNAIIGIAKAMSLKVTVEGIEQPEVADYLRRQGANFGQGYLYAKARPEISCVINTDANASSRKLA